MKKKLLSLFTVLLLLASALSAASLGASAAYDGEANPVAGESSIGMTPDEWAAEGASAAEIQDGSVTLKSNGNFGTGFMTLRTPLNSNHTEIAFEFVNEKGENRLGDNWLLLNFFTNTNVFNGWATLMDGSLSTDAIGVTMLIRGLHEGEDGNHGLRAALYTKSYDAEGNLVHDNPFPDNDDAAAVNTAIDCGGSLKLIFKQSESGFCIQFTDGTEEGTLTIDSAAVPVFADYRLEDQTGGSYFYMCTEAGWQTGTMRIHNIWSAPLYNELERYESKGSVQLVESDASAIDLWSDTRYLTAIHYEGYLKLEMDLVCLNLWDNGISGLKNSIQISLADRVSYPREIDGQSAGGLVITLRYDFSRLVVEAKVDGTNINGTQRFLTSSQAAGRIALELKTNADGLVELFVNSERVEDMSTIAALNSGDFCNAEGVTWLGFGFTATDDSGNSSELGSKELANVHYRGYTTERSEGSADMFVTVTGLPVYVLVGVPATVPQASVFHYGGLTYETVLTVTDPSGESVAITDGYTFTAQEVGNYQLTYTVTDEEGVVETYIANIAAISTAESLERDYFHNRAYWNDPFNSVSSSSVTAGALESTAHCNYNLPISLENESVSLTFTVVGLGNVGETAGDDDVECWVAFGFISQASIAGPDTSYGATGVYFLLRNSDGYLKIESMTLRDKYGVYTSEQLLTDIPMARGTQLTFTFQADQNGAPQFLINGKPYLNSFMEKIGADWEDDFTQIARQISDANGNVYLTFEAYDEDPADQIGPNTDYRCLSFDALSTQPVVSTEDIEPPVIDVNFTVTKAVVGEEIALPAAMATDAVDGTVTCTFEVRDPDGNTVTVSGRKFTAEKVGTYTVTYRASDRAGNSAELPFTIVVSAASGQGGCSGCNSGASAAVVMACLLAAAVLVKRR